MQKNTGFEQVIYNMLTFRIHPDMDRPLDNIMPAHGLAPLGCRQLPPSTIHATLECKHDTGSASIPV
jgi:hypothetical protein